MCVSEPKLGRALLCESLVGPRSPEARIADQVGKRRAALADVPPSMRASNLANALIACGAVRYCRFVPSR
jgi:hypothetical protein